VVVVQYTFTHKQYTEYRERNILNNQKLNIHNNKNKHTYVHNNKKQSINNLMNLKIIYYFIGPYFDVALIGKK
jgi:hypothetical protein